jgi:hypothetical protein
MKNNNISKYCKLAMVLLIDVIPVWFTISVNIYGSDTDFIGFWLMQIFVFFFFWNVWTLIIYCFTKRIKNLWLRDILFYFLLLLFLFSPIYFMYR